MRHQGRESSILKIKKTVGRVNGLENSILKTGLDSRLWKQLFVGIFGIFVDGIGRGYEFYISWGFLKKFLEVKSDKSDVKTVT